MTTSVASIGWRRRSSRRQRGLPVDRRARRTRNDIDLDCYRRVAWQGEAVRLSDGA